MQQTCPEPPQDDTNITKVPSNAELVERLMEQGEKGLAGRAAGERDEVDPNVAGPGEPD